jgi:CheY-like chemotaxis protein
VEQTQRVLVVDDSEVIRRLIAVNLEFAGLDVQVAVDGRHCLEAAVDWQPDLITMDINMPGLNGFETASRLRSHPDTARIPIMLLTARTHPSDRAAAERLGIEAYVTNPFEPDHLVAKVTALLREPVGESPRR